MKFRTEYEAQPCEAQLDPEQPVVLMGSCFTDYIGERMRLCRWAAYPNPCGTLYNPASIANVISIAIAKKGIFDIIKDSVVNNDPLWMSWLSDSDCTTYSQSDTEERVFGRLSNLSDKLKGAQCLIVTFGTAWVYELRKRPGYIVSNCHKFPPKTFLRRRLSVSEIVNEWKEVLGKLAQLNPDLRVIFTVSPVRHLKDGFEGNSLSKAILRMACEEICGEHQNCDYFPAFEIVNDDLRDYRFYGPDMVHPSPTAVDYIWEKFQDRYLSKASRALLAEGEKVTKRLMHRPIVYGGSQRASRQSYEAEQYYK